jgi:hypothetical protein
MCVEGIAKDVRACACACACARVVHRANPEIYFIKIRFNAIRLE